jgi:hypothetical protein
MLLPDGGDTSPLSDTRSGSSPPTTTRTAARTATQLTPVKIDCDVSKSLDLPQNFKQATGGTSTMGGIIKSIFLTGSISPHKSPFSSRRKPAGAPVPVTPPGSGVSSKRTTPNSDAGKVWDVAVDVDAYVKRTSSDGFLAAASADGTPTLKRYSSDASLTSSSSDYFAAASAAPTPTTLAPLEGWSSAARTVDGAPQQRQSGSPSSSFLTVPVQGHGSCGIGIDFVPVDGGAKIVGIAEGGSAALHGGLEVGQVFCSVNGESAAGKSVAELVLLVTGEPGSECTLELQDARGINQSVTIVRNTKKLLLLAVPVQGHGSCGIGIDFVPVDDGAKIVGIAEGGSAALHGGLEVGQVFCSVNGESAAGKSVAELVLLVTGEPGSECTLELQDARGINQSVTIVRNVNPLDLDRLIALERTCMTEEGRVQVEAPLC